MKNKLAPYLALAMLAIGCSSGKKTPPVDIASFDGITFEAADGTTVFARQVDGPDDAETLIIMFHQAGSNMGEYEPIASRVAVLGYDCLTVDLRSGGDRFERDNLTRSQFSKTPTYESAYQDLEAALAWAADLGEWRRIYVWGSSYSASLVLRLAAEHPDDVNAVLAFSPGEYFGSGNPVAGWNARVTVPCFFASTATEYEDEVESIFLSRPDTVVRHDYDFLAASRKGVHGSSALRADRNPDSSEYYWEKLEAWLAFLPQD
ncbi:MAG: alpha/beta hydrolase [Armatimonadetes bacterium]|nr:alpha/beta hydrolase [Armatimonadota bacterium]